MKLYKKKCKYCEETFFTNIRNQQFCSKECRLEHHENRSDYRLDSGNGQMCWRCANACGDCEWSGHGQPVEGWKAVKTVVKHNGEFEFYSYRIIFCPQFNQDVEIRVHR